MSTCPQCDESFRPANSDYHPFCSESCQELHREFTERRSGELEEYAEELQDGILALEAKITQLEAKCHQQQEAVAKLMAACECTAEDCRCGEFATAEARKILGL